MFFNIVLNLSFTPSVIALYIVLASNFSVVPAPSALGSSILSSINHAITLPTPGIKESPAFNNDLNPSLILPLLKLSKASPNCISVPTPGK